MAALVGLFVSLFSAWSFLEFETDRDDLISSRDALYENQRKFLLEFPRSDDVVIMVEGGTAQKRQEFVDLLAQLLQGHSESFYAIFPKVLCKFPHVTPTIPQQFIALFDSRVGLFKKIFA